MGRPFAIDFEDFHCGEHHDEAGGRRLNELADTVMRDVARGAAFITAGSRAIAGACGVRFGVEPTAVHNAFDLPADPPRWNGRAANPLRMYWFSQTIGPGRGLEDVVEAAGLTGRRCELHVRGVAARGYLESLRCLVARRAPSLSLVHHAPADPESMIDRCRDFDVGLSPEQGIPPNRQLALTNKALTYPLAGLPVVLTDTPGQRELAQDLGKGALSYRPGSIADLADGLTRWLDEPKALGDAREASWEAARRRWHWRHPDERGALLDAVRRAVG
jgi:glycosyltransferase involved in cell wall biosynthesis